MTTSSEDVLLQVSQVKYKKGDGTLYVMNERLAWMMDNRDTVSVSHKYTDIKMQKISPEGKSKIQLQVVLHDGNASTFQFVNRQGIQAQIKDRDDVKELLVQLLTKFKRKINKELEEKNRLLSEHPSLLQLYRDLVITQVVTSQEFWSQHAINYTNKLNTQTQDIGVTGAFLADVKPQTDGCNGLKYNLTTDVIDSIFKTYPSVKEKHLEYVPHKMSEVEFWTKFFQSHYFHRDRLNIGNKDVFTECAKLDEQELTKDLSKDISDPLLDITKFEDTTVDEGYGSFAPSYSASGNIVHQNMIKRFNQHSIMVLKTCERHSTNNIINNEISFSNGVDKKEVESKNGEIEGSPAKKKVRLHEKITYDDLSAKPTQDNVPSTSITLTKVERYLHGPMSNMQNEESFGEDISIAYNRIVRETNIWNLNQKQGGEPLISPANAVSILGELTPGGALMKQYEEQSLTQLVPKEIEKELLSLYTATCELLRHFWSCFPPTTKQLEEKATNMHSALHRFHCAKIKPFQDRVIRDMSPLHQNLTSHLNEMLQLAYRKYNTWQQRLHR